MGRDTESLTGQPDHQPAPPEKNADQVITFKDVLKAVFMPEDRPAGPERTAQPAQQPAAAPDELSRELPVPGAIEYTEAAIPADPSPTLRRMLTLGIGTAFSILLAYIGQTALASTGRGFFPTLLYAAAVALWIGLLFIEFRAGREDFIRRGPRITGGPGYELPANLGLALLDSRLVLFASALLLSVFTYFFTAGNIFTPLGVIAWVLSIAAWLLAAAERPPEVLFTDAWAWIKDTPQRLKDTPRPRLWTLIAAVLVLALAAFFRFYLLDSIPNEMTSDHVEKLLDAYDVSQGFFRVFFTGNGGREALQFYLVALASKLFGTGFSFLTLKLVSALEALALIPLAIYFGREMVDRETGYFMAALLAISWWNIAIGRLALRIALTPLVFTLVLICLVRGIRTGSRKAWLWAGIWMGVGVYSYQAMRIVPLVAVSAFLVSAAGPVIHAMMAHAKQRPDAPLRRAVAANTIARQGVNLLMSGLIALAIFVPMLRVWHDFPNELWNRVVRRTTSTEVAIYEKPAAVLAQNYRDALMMFNERGDSAWVSATLGQPMLDRVTAALFVLGLAAWLLRIWKRREPADAFILIAALIMLLPSALAIAFPIENPSATRASGTIPVVFLLAAWPLTLIRQRWHAVFGRWRGFALSGALIAVLFARAALLNFNTYFEDYASIYQYSALNPGEVAQAVRDVIGEDASLDGVWLQGWPYWHDFRAIGIEAGDITFTNAIVDAPTMQMYFNDYPQAFMVRPLVFILFPQDQESLVYLNHYFPGGEDILYEGDTEAHGFRLYVVRD